MKRTLIYIFILFSICSSLLAVDGYKELKFEMTKKQVQSTGLCSFEEYDSGIQGVEALVCFDFQFGGELVEAYAFFIHGYFLRLAIIPSLDVAISLGEGLKKKYGPPSASSDTREFEDVDRLPNREAFIAYDNNTVVLKIMSDENYYQSALLLYTSPKYDIRLSEFQQRSLGDDL